MNKVSINPPDGPARVVEFDLSRFPWYNIHREHGIARGPGRRECMKIVIEEPPEGTEELIIIRCRQMDPALYELIANFKGRDTAVIGYLGSDIHRIDPASVYYFEAVDNKVFIYCRQQVYESKQRLYEIEALLAGNDFLRVSKSVILNIKKINYLSPAYSGRFEAILDNQEKIIISRQYVPDLKKKLML